MAYLFNFIRVSVLLTKKSAHARFAPARKLTMHIAYTYIIYEANGTKKNSNVHDGMFQMEFSKMTAMSNIPSTLIIYTSKEN